MSQRNSINFSTNINTKGISIIVIEFTGRVIIIGLFIGLSGNGLSGGKSNMEKTLKTLEIYKIAMELSDKSRAIFSSFDYGTKKIIGDQFIRSVDSIGANIAEGYGRYHYLDSIRFYYHARGSLLEVDHRITLLEKRGLMDKSSYDELSKLSICLVRKLNNFITVVRKQTITTK